MTGKRHQNTEASISTTFLFMIPIYGITAGDMTLLGGPTLVGRP